MLASRSRAVSATWVSPRSGIANPPVSKCVLPATYSILLACQRVRQGGKKRAEAGAGVHRVQAPTLPVRLRGRIEDKGCDRQVIGTPGLTCEGRHHRGILEHLLQGVLPCVSKARSL